MWPILGTLLQQINHVSTLEYDKLGKLKRKCPDGAQWQADKHMPSVARVVNTVTAVALRDLERREQKAASLPEELRMISMVRIQLERDLLMKTESFEVNVLDPYEQVKYLSVWIQPAVFAPRAVEAATQLAVKIAGAMGSACMKPWEATMVSRCTAAQQVSYSLKTAQFGQKDNEGVDRPFRQMMKHKMGNCRSYPNHAFDAAQYNNFDDVVLVDKVMMMLRLVSLDHCVAKAIKGMLWET